MHEPLAAPASGSCIHCHMAAREGRLVPHTSHTDHRVLRQPIQGSPNGDDSPDSPDDGAYQMFAGADQRLPKAVLDRARGLAMTECRREIKSAPLTPGKFFLYEPGRPRHRGMCTNRAAP